MISSLGDYRGRLCKTTLDYGVYLKALGVLFRRSILLSTLSNSLESPPVLGTIVMSDVVL
jgi:hypothetical protein